MQEIELYSKLNDPLSAIGKLGEMFAKSGMFGCERVEQGQVLAMACLSERKSPVQILREYHIIEGRLSDRADSMLAKFRAAGGKHKVIARTADVAEVELTHDGQTLRERLTWAEVQEEPFVWSNKTDAKGNRLPKKNYATPRARMQTMWARVISDGVRTLAPEIVAGIMTPEEIADDAAAATPTAAPLLPPLPEPKPALPEPPREINVEVLPSPAPAPRPEPAPEPAQVASEPAPESNHLADKLAKLEDLLAPHAEKAIEWLKAKGWIEDDLLDLSKDRIDRILAKPDAFIKTIGA